MGFLVPNNRRDTYVQQPHLIRYHHAARSPMNSERLNLEKNLFLFDIYKLYELLNSLNLQFETYMNSLYTDVTPVSGYQITWPDSVGAEAININSIKVLSAALNDFEMRIRSLEDQR